MNQLISLVHPAQLLFRASPMNTTNSLRTQAYDVDCRK